MNLILPDESCASWLTALIAGNGLLPTLQVALFDSDLEVSRYTILDELLPIECTFAGYARWNLSGWSLPILGGPLSASTEADTPEFSITSGSVEIFGVFLTDSSDSGLYGVGRFSEPITMADTRTLFLDFVLTLSSLFGS